MSAFEDLQKRLKNQRQTWVITGVAGFIGSHLLEALLRLDQVVVGLDNFNTGSQDNLDEVRSLVSTDQWARFSFVEGDIRSLPDCEQMLAVARDMTGAPADYVLHQAALGSVPRSVHDPINTNANNIDGFLNVMVAARDAGIKRLVYAASSSTYGDHPGLPKVEQNIGRPLSPYAVTKLVNELYADVFARVYGFPSIGLRYFNVFGPRQQPNGAYAAVIPKWIISLIRGEQVIVNGDGLTSRDFCYIDNVVQANLLAATADIDGLGHEVLNVAFGAQTTLNQLYYKLCDEIGKQGSVVLRGEPVWREFRAGDVMHSLADIAKAQRLLGYQPSHSISDGLAATIDWYLARDTQNKKG